MSYLKNVKRRLRVYVLSGRCLNNPFILAAVLVLLGLLVMTVGPLFALMEGLGRLVAKVVDYLNTEETLL